MPSEEWQMGDLRVEGDGGDQVFFAYWRGRYCARYERAPYGWAVQNFDDLLLLDKADRAGYEWCRQQWMIRMRRASAN